MSWKSELARVASLAVGPVGLQISRSGSLGRNWHTVLPHLKTLGFDPRHVIDVGAGSGTSEIYRHFPDAELFLFEPLEECATSLRALAGQRQARVVEAVVGATEGSVTLHVHDDLLGSSVLAEVEGGGDDGVARDVKMVTLDGELADADLAGGVLLKVDVQGAELDVFEGGSATLASTTVVVVECSLLPTMEGGAEILDVLNALRVHGFVLFDLMGGLERPLDNSLSQVDAVLVRSDSPWRADRRFRNLA